MFLCSSSPGSPALFRQHQRKWFWDTDGQHLECTMVVFKLWSMDLQHHNCLETQPKLRPTEKETLGLEHRNLHLNISLNCSSQCYVLEILTSTNWFESLVLMSSSYNPHKQNICEAFCKFSLSSSTSQQDKTLEILISIIILQ